MCPLSSQVRRGEVLVFLGFNGAGKSTTMQIIVGTLAAGAGCSSAAPIDLVEAMGRSKTRCGLLDQSGPPMGNLSKGYQQRVGIPQTVLHAPALVTLEYGFSFRSP